MKTETAKGTSNATSSSKGITAVAHEIILDKDLPNGPFKTYCVLAMLAQQDGETYSGIPLDNVIISNTSLSDGAFRLYCIMGTFYIGDPVPLFYDTETIAFRMRCSISSARRYIKELTDAGIIEKVRYKYTKDFYETGFIVHDCIRDTAEAYHV